MALAADDLTGKVKQILERDFEGAEVDMGLFFGAQRVSGQIIWDGFEGQE